MGASLRMLEGVVSECVVALLVAGGTDFILVYLREIQVVVGEGGSQSGLVFDIVFLVELGLAE